MNRIYLVRHGENVANITKEFSHRLVDYDLTEKGVLQAQQTAEYFKNIPIDYMFSSPLKRAMQTADEISKTVGKGYEVVENFREVNVGDLEKCPPDKKSWDIYFDVSNNWYDGNMEVSFPGGETYTNLYKRFADGLRYIIKEETDSNILVVGHAGIFTFGIMELFQVENRHDFDQLPNCNCSVTEILVDNTLTEKKLIRWADGSHLHGEAAKIVSSYPQFTVGDNVKDRIK